MDIDHESFERYLNSNQVTGISLWSNMLLLNRFAGGGILTYEFTHSQRSEVLGKILAAGYKLNKSAGQPGLFDWYER